MKNIIKLFKKNIVKLIGLLPSRSEAVLKICQLIYTLKLNIRNYISQIIWRVIPWQIEINFNNSQKK